MNRITKLKLNGSNNFVLGEECKTNTLESEFLSKLTLLETELNKLKLLFKDSNDDIENKLEDIKNLKNALKYLLVYKQVNQKPDKPTGGSYDFNNDIFICPEGWSITNNFTGKINIWWSYNIFYSDETASGWSDPVCYINYDELFDELHDKLDQLYQDMLDNGREELEDLLNTAQIKLNDAKTKLKEAQDRLDAMTTLSEGDAYIKVNEAIGKITQFAEYLEKDESGLGSINTLIQELNAQKGTISTLGENVNTLTQTVNTVSLEFNAKKATITTTADNVNVLTNTVNTVLTMMDAMNGTLTNAVSTANTANNTATSVKESFDAFQGSWLVTVNEAVESGILNGLSSGLLKVTSDEIISALVNTEGAGTAIIQSINGSNSQVSISADKILLDGDTIAQILLSRKLIINNGASIFEPDGSGHIANANIRWDSDGNVWFGGNAIKIDGESGLVTDLNLIEFPIGTILRTEIKDKNPFNSTWEERASGEYIKMTSGSDSWLLHKEIKGFDIEFEEVTLSYSDDGTQVLFNSPSHPTKEKLILQQVVFRDHRSDNSGPRPEFTAYLNGEDITNQVTFDNVIIPIGIPDYFSTTGYRPYVTIKQRIPCYYGENYMAFATLVVHKDYYNHPWLQAERNQNQ